MELNKMDEVDLAILSTVISKKKSNGQIFKEKNSYSKTKKRLMTKYSVSLDELKAMTKERKKLMRAKQKDKHSIKKVIRGGKKK